MSTSPTELQDMHVHSTFSDGEGTVQENVTEAERLGLEALTCVDHVRHDTDWHPGFVAEVRRVAAGTEVELLCGLEAKLLDPAGNLDLPADLGGADRIYAADHQVPLAEAPTHPRYVAEQIEKGAMAAQEVIETIVESTIGAVRRHGERLVIAHLFSVLPKAGMSEEDVPLELIERLAAATAESGATVEISERWACPATRTVRPFAEAGAKIVLSTDSHSPQTIGRYDHCHSVLTELALAT